MQVPGINNSNIIINNNCNYNNMSANTRFWTNFKASFLRSTPKTTSTTITTIITSSIESQPKKVGFVVVFGCGCWSCCCWSCCSSYYNTRSTVFLWSFGCLLHVFHFRDKCAGFTIKISCETLGFPGNLVPRDYPTLLEIPLELCLKGLWTLVWISCETLLKYPWNFPKAPMKLS